jgi:carbon monoxide dehydrogenase subunit G
MRCVHGSGNVISESRDVAEYNSISVGGSANLFIAQGPIQSLRIEAEDNILKIIRTKVNGRTLEIENKRCIKNHKPINIYATMPDVKKLQIMGSGKIIGETKITTNKLDINISGSGKANLEVDAEKVRTRISGSGDMSFSGHTTDFEVTISGSGNIMARNLQTNNSSVTVSGSGDCIVSVQNELDVTISGSGRVEYYGDPLKMNSNISGSGKLKKGER